MQRDDDDDADDGATYGCRYCAEHSSIQSTDDHNDSLQTMNLSGHAPTVGGWGYRWLQPPGGVIAPRTVIIGVNICLFVVWPISA